MKVEPHEARKPATLDVFAWTVLAIALGVGLLLAAWPRAEQGASQERGHPPQRIVSLAPSLTEIVFALGAGAQVVGVSSYCDYPPEARSRARLGGHLDPRLEPLLALRPELVLLLDAPALAQRLRELGVVAASFQSNTLAELEATIRAVGAHLHASPRAEELVQRLRREIEGLAPQTSCRPRVLVVVGHEPGRLRSLYIAGAGSYVGELLAAVGLRNAVDGAEAYPALGLEGLVQSEPEAIIELGSMSQEPAAAAATIGLWQTTLPTLPAVAAGQIFVLGDPAYTIPGPRLGLLARELARVRRELCGE